MALNWHQGPLIARTINWQGPSLFFMSYMNPEMPSVGLVHLQHIQEVFHSMPRCTLGPGHPRTQRPAGGGHGLTPEIKHQSGWMERARGELGCRVSGACPQRAHRVRATAHTHTQTSPQASWTSSAKGQAVNRSCFLGHTASAAAVHLCCHSTRERFPHMSWPQFH